MSNIKGFNIVKNVLKEYKGKDTDVVVPDGVTSIGRDAFSFSTRLRSIIIPEGVKTIESGAFFGCSNLENIDLPKTLKSIGTSSFYGCCNLTRITLPEGVTKIGEQAFPGSARIIRYSNALENTTECLQIKEGILKRYCGSGGEVVVPDGVTSISNWAFVGCSNLTSITLPETLISIGKYAFCSCINLTNINLPEGLKRIGEGAFKDCISLSDLLIPTGVKVLERGLFRDCEALQNIHLQRGLLKIDSAVFSGCKKLISINIPDTVNEIGTTIYDIEDDPGAFNHCGLTSIVIPDSVAEIRFGAFKGCPDLRRIIVLGAPTFVKEGYAEIPPELLTTTLPITGIKSLELKRRAVLGWILRQPGDPPVEEKVSDSVRKYWAKSLDAFLDVIHDDPRVLPALIDNELLTLDQIETILQSFAGNAEAVASLLEYKRRRFSQEEMTQHEEKSITKALNGPTAAELKKIWTTNVLDNGSIELVSYKGSETEIIIPEKIGKKIVTSISAECFSTGWPKKPIKNIEVRKRITSVEIPDSVTNIGHRAFEGCESLKKITIPDSVKSIEWNAFEGCTSLSSVIIPNSVTSIGTDAFNGTAWYKNQPNGLVYAGRIAYKYKGDMPQSSDIIINEGTREITGEAFHGCTNLTSVTIPESVMSIGSYAFSDCISLTSITLGKKIKKIGYQAFSHCDNLTIHAPAGSYAEQYAKEHNIPFVAE